MSPNGGDVDGWAELTRSARVDASGVETVLGEVLDAVESGSLPEAAQSFATLYFGRFLREREYYFHHFAPFAAYLADHFDVDGTKARLLDIGCGLGLQANVLAARGASVTGIDADPLRISVGKLLHERFEAEAGTDLDVDLQCNDAATGLNAFGAATFDGAYTQFALAYMKPQRDVMRELHRVIRPGGHLVLREFNAGGVYNRMWRRLPWPSDVTYREIAEPLGWRLVDRTHHWFVPKRGVRALGRQRVTAIENWCEERRFAPALAAAFTLVFER